MSSSYRDLRIWQCSMKLVLGIYATTAQFPKHELYGLMSQMRRAAVSVPSNIAEGKGRLTDRDRAHFYLASKGFAVRTGNTDSHRSATQLHMPRGDEPLLQLSAEVGRMLSALVESIAQHATHRRQNAS